MTNKDKQALQEDLIGILKDVHEEDLKLVYRIVNVMRLNPNNSRIDEELIPALQTRDDDKILAVVKSLEK